MERHLVIVPHTHWDREWYRTHEEFRTRLVRLLDGLLELLERDPAFRHFTLDGQTVVLGDYLEVRPEARERIERLVRAGRLLVGPWFVLPDEWLVSGEALVRNLRLGLSQAAAVGGSMRLGYVPDQFGHVGQLPQIFSGFGLEGACLWRGVGEDVQQTLFHWEAPDGTRLLTIYLMRGYGNAAGLPLEPSALADRLRSAADELAPHSPVSSLLLMNGSDHLMPQAGLPAALAAAAEKLDGHRVEIGSLPGFFERARGEAPSGLGVHRGELRSGLRAPLLVGCASARLPQKQADFRNDRLLTRYLEPLAAWLGELGGDADPGLIELAWRVALENHPHDSICGCSIDAVHDEMDTRFARVEQLGRSHLERVTRELGSRVRAERHAFGRGAGPGLVVWNPHGAGRTGCEGELELDGVVGRRAPALHLRTTDGRRLPVRVELVAPEETLADYQLPARVAAVLLRGFPPEFTGLSARAADLRASGGKLDADVWLGSEPREGFDFAAARDATAARLVAAGDAPTRYRVRRLPRLRLRFVDELPGHGLRVYRVARGRAGGEGELASGATAAGAAWIENAAWRVEVSPEGRVRCEHRADGVVLEDAVRLVSEGDRGDEYNFDPVPGATPVERPDRVRVKPGPGSEAEVEVRIDARYRVPAGLEAGRAARQRRLSTLPVRLTLRLAAGLDRVDVRVEFDNTARDHRLRLHLRAPFRARRLEVESAFEVVERPIAPAPDAFGAERPAELPIGATPQRGFASLCDDTRGLTLASRGLTEVEAVPEPGGETSLALTLLRAVGWLSRGDLVLRPGHAGPALETPGAQQLGPGCAELSFRLHAAEAASRTREAHAFGAPALAFAGGVEAGPLGDGARLLEVEDPEVIVSAIEPCRVGAPLARLYNASARARELVLRWPGRPGPSRAVDLAGRVLAEESGPERAVTLRPWQIATFRPEAGAEES